MPTNFSWEAFGKLYLYFFYFSGLTQILIYATGISNTVGIRQAILISILWIIPALAWPQHTRRISAVIGLLIWPASLTSLSYFNLQARVFAKPCLPNT